MMGYGYVTFSDGYAKPWRFTLPETNIAPENTPLEKEIPIGKPSFLGAMLVSGRVILQPTLNDQSNF